MAVASRLRTASVSFLCSSSLRPFIQSMVSSRPVESSGHTLGTRMAPLPFSINAVERDVLGLADIIEFLAQAGGDFLGDFGGVERRIETLADGEQQFQLAHVGFDRRLHVGILKFAGELRAVERVGAVHLTERSRRRRVMFEALEFAFPGHAEFGVHAALDEGPAHRRRLALQLGQFGGVFRRQGIGDGGEQLRHLHDRTLQAAERGGEPDGIGGAVALRADQALADHARGDAADLAADIGVALGAGGEAVFFAVGGGHG